MITINNIEEVREQDYDEVWAIVRKLKSNPNNFRHVNDLSPSLELLNIFLTSRENGEWNKKAFDEIYVPVFLKEIKSNSYAQELIDELYNRDITGESIANGTKTLEYRLWDEKRSEFTVYEGILLEL